MGDVQTQIDYPRGLGFEQVWAALMRNQEQLEKSSMEFDRRMQEADRRMQETDRQMQETDRRMQETDRQMQETDRQMKETDRQMKETDRQRQETDRQMKETDRQMKEVGKRFGDFTNRFGEVVEYMIAPNLQDKFYDMGMDFQTVSSNFKVNDHKNNIHFQIDVFLQNGDTAMLVEIKTKLTISDINDHIKRMEKMRMFADLRGDKRAFLGAVAGVIVEADERDYALNNGFYLIQPSGETFNITSPQHKPKEW